MSFMSSRKVSLLVSVIRTERGSVPQATISRAETIPMINLRLGTVSILVRPSSFIILDLSHGNGLLFSRLGFRGESENRSGLDASF